MCERISRAVNSPRLDLDALINARSPACHVLSRFVGVGDDVIERSFPRAQTAAQVGAAQTAPAAATQTEFNVLHREFFFSRVFEDVNKCQMKTNTAIDLHDELLKITLGRTPNRRHLKIRFWESR